MNSVYAKLQSGERFEAPNEEKVASILENLHPDYSAEATFCLGEDEWLSASGCVSDGFCAGVSAAVRDARQVLSADAFDGGGSEVDWPFPSRRARLAGGIPVADEFACGSNRRGSARGGRHHFHSGRLQGRHW